MRSRVSCASAQSDPTASDISTALEISKRCRDVKPSWDVRADAVDSRAVRYCWAVLGWVALACAASAPQPKATAHKHEAAAEVAFPPTGPIELRAANTPPEGTLYRVFTSYQGRSEVTEGAHGEPKTVDEKTSVEIDYRQMPVATPTTDEIAFSLVLEALNRRTRMSPPGSEHLIELGDDRLRVQVDNKVQTDLRGAQPKQNLTPRTVLGKPFALLVDDAFGNPKGITLSGLPAAKKMLSTLPLRDSLGYLQIGFPNKAISPGDTWHAKRFFANPIGKLGLAIDVELRLVGFERVDEAPCAHVVLRSSQDGTNVPSEAGFKFDEVHYQLMGDAWLDLSNGQVARARIEDVAAVSFQKSASASPMRVRMRYQGVSALTRLDDMPAATTWADGHKRFSAVNENRPNAPAGGAPGRY